MFTITKLTETLQDLEALGAGAYCCLVRTSNIFGVSSESGDAYFESKGQEWGEQNRSVFRPDVESNERYPLNDYTLSNTGVQASEGLRGVSPELFRIVYKHTLRLDDIVLLFDGDAFKYLMVAKYGFIELQCIHVKTFMDREKLDMDKTVAPVVSVLNTINRDFGPKALTEFVLNIYYEYLKEIDALNPVPCTLEQLDSTRAEFFVATDDRYVKNLLAFMLRYTDPDLLTGLVH